MRRRSRAEARIKQKLRHEVERPLYLDLGGLFLERLWEGTRKPLASAHLRLYTPVRIPSLQRVLFKDMSDQYSQKNGPHQP